jgi:RHS repeat-associated protein
MKSLLTTHDLRTLCNKCTKMLAILAFMFYCQNSLHAAGIDVFYNDISGDKIKKGASFVVKDDRFQAPEWQKIEKTLEVKDKIVFQLDHNSQLMKKDRFVCTISLKVQRWSAKNDSTTTTEQLSVSYDPAPSAVSPYQQVLDFQGAHKVKITVLDIQYSQVGWSDRSVPPAIFKLDATIEVNRILAFDCTGTVSTLTSALDATTDRLGITWAVLDGVEEYDVEWTFYDQFSDLVTNILTVSFPVATGFSPIFENNATRVTSTLNQYQLPMVYPNGYIFYRVRGARIFNGLREVTKWTSQNSSGILNTFTHKFQNAAAHEAILNWQTQTTFAEEGKNAQSVSYFDGSLRSRQQVTLSRADATVLVQETIYDHQGRPAVQVMPTPPQSTTSTYLQKLEYYPAFAKNNSATPVPYSKTDFDIDGANCYTSTVNGMSTAFGASWYYSTSNTKNATSFHKFIPNANLYPFSVTEYTPDLTGRVKRQGGVGSILALPYGKDVRYFYGKPSKNELVRLFGTNVGHESHYQKNMVRDQNGQFSVSYVDAHGRTIATALAGTKPANVSQVPLQIGQGSAPLERNLLNNIIKDNSIVSSYTLLVTEAQTATLTYSVNDTTYREACMPANVCYSCYYDVKIIVEDNCGISAPVSYNITNVPGSKIFPQTCPVGTPSLSTALTLTQSHIFSQVGEYQITKILTPSKDAIDYYATEYVKTACVTKTEAQLLTEFKKEIDFNCFMSCDSCKTRLTAMGATSNIYLTKYITQVTAGGGIPTAQDTAHAIQLYDEVKASCNEICEDSPNRCESFYQLLLADVSPGGQYAAIDISGDCVVDDPASVLFNNQYKNPASPYLNELGRPDTVLIDGVGYLPKDLPLCDFVRNWNPSWAKSLVSFHPEFCLYLNCKSQVINNTRDSAMWATQTYGQAVAAGFFNVASDPFFSSTAGSPYLAQMTDYLNNTAKYGCETYTLVQTLTSFLLCDGVLPCASTISTACLADQNLFWQMYRQAYLGRKYPFYTAAIAAGCNQYACIGVPTCSISPNLYATKLKRWTPYDPLAAPSTIEDVIKNQQIEGEAGMTAACDDNCQGVVDYWFSKVKTGGCLTVTPADSIALRPVLLQLCTKSCDVNHPYGATTAPPGVTVGIGNFTNVISIFKNNTTTICDTVCNNLLIGFPGEYTSPMPTARGRAMLLRPNPDTCLCNRLARFDLCAGVNAVADSLNVLSDIKITKSEVDSLRKLCMNTCKSLYKPITIPPPLECGVCKTCGEINALVAQFNTATTTCTTTFSTTVNVASYNKMLTAYLNTKTGMKLTWSEYNAFRTKCATNTLSVNCKAVLMLCPRSPIPSAVADTACYAEQLAIATANAKEAYQVQLDALRRDFQNRYLKACLAPIESFKTNLTLNEYHYTLYFYDQAGNLTRTVPPEGVTVGTGAITPTLPSYTLETKYKYECFNQIAEQITPDGNTTRFWYDRLGRLVVSQDARQAAASPKLYSYSLYDNLGRVIEVGEKTLGNTSGTAQADMTSVISKDPVALTAWINFSSTPVSPTPLRNDITRTYYDNLPSYAANITALPTTGVNEWTNLRKRVASTTFEAANDNNDATYNYATHYSYDIAGNVKTLVQDIVELDPFSNRFKRIDYNYDLISGKVNKVIYQNGKTDKFVHRYTYDLNNRLIKAETSANEIVWEIDAEYQYYFHGPLARTVLGQRKVQGLDYAYTLQGWLKGVNADALSPVNDMGLDGYTVSASTVNTAAARDAFGFVLSYHGGDYAKIGASAQPFEMGTTAATGYRTDSPDLYNGNIKSNSQQIKNIGTVPRGYVYRYDQLNRLTEMDMWERLGTAFSWTTTLTRSLAVSERIKYDANGNIKNYIRHGQGGALLAMDSLTYNYYTGTNKLKLINDIVAPAAYAEDVDDQTAGAVAVTDPCTGLSITGSNYVYDCAGNIVRDQSQGSLIAWNSYGKVRNVTRGTQIMSFGYDALQNRVLKSVVNGAVTTKTYYIRDAQGNILATYALSNGTTMKLTELNLFGSARLGTFRADHTVFPVPSPGTSISTNYLGKKQYELSNHLGNVLAVVSDNPLGVDSDANGSVNYYEPVVTSAQEYYPFGMTMPSRTYQLAGASTYRFGFNGKEADKNNEWGLTQYDYGFRIYSPAVGRFLSVDPLMRSFPYWSPYAFAGNTPIQAIDLDGSEIEDYRVDLDDKGHGTDFKWVGTNTYSYGYPSIMNLFGQFPAVNVYQDGKLVGRYSAFPSGEKGFAEAYRFGTDDSFRNQYMATHESKQQSDTRNAREVGEIFSNGLVAAAGVKYAQGRVAASKGVAQTEADKPGSAAQNAKKSTAEDLAKAKATELRNADGRPPTMTAAAIDLKTGEISYGVSGKPLPTKIPYRIEIQTPPVSLEYWHVYNCAELKAVVDRVNKGSLIENLEVHTVRTITGVTEPRCANCQLTTKGVNATNGDKPPPKKEEK